jgi:hypothetical protein
MIFLQGGGSLGAFGCGVFKALSKNNIKINHCFSLLDVGKVKGRSAINQLQERKLAE